MAINGNSQVSSGKLQDNFKVDDSFFIGNQLHTVFVNFSPHQGYC